MGKPSIVPVADGDQRPFVTVDRTRPIPSDALFLSGNEALIQHQGKHYRLRRTRNGKLILTK
jgi:hemin uptake protein HemP